MAEIGGIWDNPISGIRVKFPFDPYPQQLAFMNHVIKALKNPKKDESRALLESPTGTGKTLCLLCAILAWEQNNRLATGEITKVFYATRTHAQISEVSKQLKLTPYKNVEIAVLASRTQYCINSNAKKHQKIDLACQMLIKEKVDPCLLYNNASGIVDYTGEANVLDIEELCRIGGLVHGCPYYASRLLLKKAVLILCPYNYVIDPSLREMIGINLDGNVLIFDEAHNIEDAIRENASFDLEEQTFADLFTDLDQVRRMVPGVYQDLLDMTQGIIDWMKSWKLVFDGCNRDSMSWKGANALKELQRAKISLENFQLLHECAQEAISDSSEPNPKEYHLSVLVVPALKGLFYTLTLFFSENGNNVNNFVLALQRAKKDEGGWTMTLSLWCMSPACVFKSIAESARSVLLTSGTLSPLKNFSSELGVQFATTFKAKHVINVEKQLWTSVICHSPSGFPLEGTFKKSTKLEYQDAIGASLVEICKVVPGGCLVFFPSYSMQEKLTNSWKVSGKWNQLAGQKTIFVEPRDGGTDSLETVLSKYKECAVTSKGAVFLTVCRGKVSEGLDFKNELARAVVIVGIPFPNPYDIKVEKKKEFNDNKRALNHPSGTDWYNQQTFRAVNQAAGRCIRHKDDYGAIIFLDERFKLETNQRNISAWMLQSMRSYNKFEESSVSLRSFFRSFSRDA